MLTRWLRRQAVIGLGVDRKSERAAALAAKSFGGYRRQLLSPPYQRP
jgi:hypothetical protein